MDSKYKVRQGVLWLLVLLNVLVWSIGGLATLLVWFLKSNLTPRNFENIIHSTLTLFVFCAGALFFYILVGRIATIFGHISPVLREREKAAGRISLLDAREQIKYDARETKMVEQQPTWRVADQDAEIQIWK